MQPSSLVFHDSLPAKPFGGRLAEDATSSDGDALLAVMGLPGGHHVIEPVLPRVLELPHDDFHEKGELHELTQLSSHDIKFDGLDFHAEFIAQPVCLPSANTEMRTTTSDWGGAVASSYSHLPSFTDTYTPSVITTIEPRVFGAEAEYISRLKQRRGSSSERSEGGSQARSSVIVSVTAGEASRASPPAPALLPQYTFLPCPGEPGDSDGSHLTLKAEPEVGSPYYSTSPGSYSPRLPCSSPALPNFLHFTPDESVAQRVAAQVAPAPQDPLKHTNGSEPPAK